MSTIPDDVARRALELATKTTLSMSLFLEFYERGVADERARMDAEVTK